MGRKKRKYVKPWCWYCNREFEDEAVLIQHQKERFFFHDILLWLNNCPLKNDYCGLFQEYGVSSKVTKF